MPVRSIQNWEQGHRLPRADALLKLSRALDVSLENLLAGIVETPPAKSRKRK